MYNIRTLQDVQIALQDVEAKIRNIGLRDWDLKGFQIKNLGASRDKKDAVIREELSVLSDGFQKEIRKINDKLTELELRISDLEP